MISNKSFENMSEFIYLGTSQMEIAFTNKLRAE